MTLDLTATQLTDPGDGLPLLVVGPSIGTSVTALWSSCAAQLAGRFHVVGWDLPGHGRSATTHEPFTMADLAAAVVSLVDKIDPSTGSGHDPSTGSGHDLRQAQGTALRQVQGASRASSSTPGIPPGERWDCNCCSTHRIGSSRQ